MKKLNSFLVMLFLVAMSFTVEAQVFADEQNVANKGYDVVSYFTTNSAQRGSKNFSASNKNVTYYFASDENKKLFVSNPTKYLPQFDGYCAFAVAKMNQKVPVDPETFRVDDGKLFLFFNDYYEGAPFNTIIPWIQNESEMEKLAYANWKALK